MFVFFSKREYINWNVSLYSKGCWRIQISVFKDDIRYETGAVQRSISLNNLLQETQTNLVQMKKSKESESSDVETHQEIEDSVDITLFGNDQQRQKQNNEILESIQENVNLIETTKQGLLSIDEHLQNIEEKIEKRVDKEFKEEDLENIKKSIKEDLKNIKDIVKNTSFNDIKPLDSSSSNNIKTNAKNNSIISVSSVSEDTSLRKLIHEESPSIDIKEDAEKLLQKVQKTIKEVKNKQENLTNTEEKIIQKVDSLIEFESELSKRKEGKKEIGTQLKEAAINSINQDPQAGRQVQIVNIDEDLILGLLSIVQRG